MGVVYTKNLYTQHGWIPNQIEMYLKVHSGPAGLRGGYATYESAGKSHLLLNPPPSLPQLITFAYTSTWLWIS